MSLFIGEVDFTHAIQDEAILGNFKSMSIGTQYSDSSNDNNIFPPHTMSYGQSSSNPSGVIDEEYGMINYPHVEQMSSTFHIRCNKSMEKLWVQVKTFMHDMFDPIINIIGTSCPGMSIVFTKMGSLH